MDRRLRVNGRMGGGTGWEWRRGADGYTGASGRVERKDGTEYGRALPRRPSTRARGLADFRTATDPKHMPMEVSLVQ